MPTITNLPFFLIRLNALESAESSTVLAAKISLSTPLLFVRLFIVFFKLLSLTLNILSAPIELAKSKLLLFMSSENTLAPFKVNNLVIICPIRPTP